MTQIAYISTYVPKKCGLATYTHHLRQAVGGAKGTSVQDKVIAVVSPGEDNTRYHPSVWTLRRDVRQDYRNLAARINDSAVAAVSLQHEFGIFGGNAGEYVLDFARALRKPLITTFHTVFEHPKEPYRSIQDELCALSRRIVVMNRRAVTFLNNAFGVPEDKIFYLPHGTPTPMPEQRAALRERFGWADKKVVLTFGLLGRGKGIELILKALPKVVQRVPNVVYALVGQTHPDVLRHEGEAYRNELLEMVHDLGLDEHVQMVNRYLTEEELVEVITACDLYVTPYPGMEQITSGTLAYAVGLGRPVLSTPYAYARDLLAGLDELLIPYGDVDTWADTMVRMLSDASLHATWEHRIREIGQHMQWPNVGATYWHLVQDVLHTEKGRVAGGSALASISR